MSTASPYTQSLRIRGKSPAATRTQRSYPMLVRDGIMKRVKVMPYFAAFTFSTNKMLQIQPQDLPLCGVYLIQETLSPDGDANAGEPRFRCIARIGFSVIVQNNDADAAEYELDTAMQALAGGLFSDPTLYNNNEFKIQSYTTGLRSHVFGSAGLDNETPIAELRFELACDLGTITYPPFVPDDLEVIHVEVVAPDGTPKITAGYDIEQ